MNEKYKILNNFKKNPLGILLKQVYLNIIYFFCNCCIPISEWRANFYKFFHPDFYFSRGVKLRKNITFYAGSRLTGKLVIGEKSFLNDECYIDYSSKVIIGKHVAIGMRSIILSSSHKIGNPIRCGVLSKKTTIIKDNCWIGAGAIIYPGITIEEGSVISAGEIVSFDIPQNRLLKNGELVVIRESKINELGV